jgi:hypothetical protein
MRRRPLTATCVVVVAALGLLTAGCGGGASPGIAKLGAGATDTTPATTTRDGSGSPDKPFATPVGGAHLGFQIAMNVGTATGAKFAACMRKHGVTNFPDPNSQGVITLHSGMGIDPTSPGFTSARTACQKLLPNGGQPTPAQVAQRQQQMLAFSNCMRAHGLKDFPDPSGGGLRIHVQPGSDLDPNNPTFQSAQQACQRYLPFKPGGTASGGK